MKKSQADIISSVIIIIITLSLVSSIYFWGIPLIKKRQDTTLVERVAKNINFLDEKIKAIAANGGEYTFTIDTTGLWILYPNDISKYPGYATPENNSIQFTFTSIVSNIASECPEGSGKPCGWIPNTCGGRAGTLGIDDSSIICKRADRTGTNFNITYKIWFRQLEEDPINPASKGVKIILSSKNPAGPFRSTGKSIRIFQGDTRNCPASECGKNLIITEIKILLG